MAGHFYCLRGPSQRGPFPARRSAPPQGQGEPGAHTLGKAALCRDLTVGQVGAASGCPEQAGIQRWRKVSERRAQDVFPHPLPTGLELDSDGPQENWQWSRHSGLACLMTMQEPAGGSWPEPPAHLTCITERQQPKWGLHPSTRHS